MIVTFDRNEVVNMCKLYGYCRISRKEQSIDRQIRNIETEYPNAVIIQEAFTGTKVEGRKEFEKLLRTVKGGDTIVFDSVSRMSRNAAEGIELYEKLYKQGVNLVFLKEHHIDTATYDKAISDTVPMTGTSVDIILEAVNEYLRVLRKEQIALAFEQAQKEVDDLHKRTREGIETARLNGKQIGGVKGKTLKVKKANEMKPLILKYSKSFNGTLTDKETIKLIGIAPNTFYKYKKELREEIEGKMMKEFGSILNIIGRSTQEHFMRKIAYDGHGTTKKQREKEYQSQKDAFIQKYGEQGKALFEKYE